MDRLQIDRWLESMKMRRSLQWRSSRSWINLSDGIPSHRDSKKSCWSLFKWASWRGILKNSRKASEKKKFVTSQGLRRLMQNISRCSLKVEFTQPSARTRAWALIAPAECIFNEESTGVDNSQNRLCKCVWGRNESEMQTSRETVEPRKSKCYAILAGEERGSINNSCAQS